MKEGIQAWIPRDRYEKESREGKRYSVQQLVNTDTGEMITIPIWEFENDYKFVDSKMSVVVRK